MHASRTMITHNHLGRRVSCVEDQFQQRNANLMYIGWAHAAAKHTPTASIAPGQNRQLYGLDLPALLAFAHLAFIASDLAFLNAGEVYLLRVTPRTFARAVLDGPSPLFAAHLAL